LLFKFSFCKSSKILYYLVWPLENIFLCPKFLHQLLGPHHPQDLFIFSEFQCSTYSFIPTGHYTPPLVNVVGATTFTHLLLLETQKLIAPVLVLGERCQT
jgi:hypothetical protein